MITQQELLERLEAGENVSTEFKAGRLTRQVAARMAVAFANGEGEGWLVNGVKDTPQGFELVGVSDSDKLTSLLQDACRQLCQPPIEPVLETVMLNDKAIVVMRVRGRAAQRPYKTADNGYVIREADTTRVVTLERALQHVVAERSLLQLLYVENFRSLYGMDLGLKSITVVIGPNASGKSNLFKALRFLQDGMVGDISQWEANSKRGDELLWFGLDEQGRRPDRIVLDFSAKFQGQPLANSLNYRLEVRWKQERLWVMRESLAFGSPLEKRKLYFERDEDKVRLERGQPGARQPKELFFRDPHRLYFREYLSSFEHGTAEALVRFVQGWRFVNIDVDKARQSSIDVTVEPKSVPPLRGDGSNLAEVLYALRKIEPERFEEIVDRLGRSIGFPRDVQVQYLSSLGGLGEARFAFAETAFPGREISPGSMSDGTIRLLALLTALIGDPQATVICIEEPDHGLHPHLMLRLADAIRSVVDVEPGEAIAQFNRPQIILTTHSPDFMDCFDVTTEADYLRVYITERNFDDGKTEFLPADASEFLPWLERYRLGDAVRRSIFS